MTLLFILALCLLVALCAPLLSLLGDVLSGAFALLGSLIALAVGAAWVLVCIVLPFALLAWMFH